MPVFDTVAEAVRETRANASLIFVPPPYAADAVLEAIDADCRWSCASPKAFPRSTWCASPRLCAAAKRA